MHSFVVDCSTIISYSRRLRCRWQTRATQCLAPTMLMSTVSVINCWPRPSPVYHIDCLPKLPANETISRSRDMVGAHQNLNRSRRLRGLTTSFQEWCDIRGLAQFATISLFLPNLMSLYPFTIKIWVAIQNVENGVVWGSYIIQGHCK